jgi:uncharacterized protein
MTGFKTLLACAALLSLAGITAAEAATPSFSCAGRKSATERAICGSARLASLDRRMSRQYWDLYNALARSDQRALRSDQRTWLANRNACNGDAGCIEVEYLDRINQLAEWD